jgi:hypothetical protein
VAFLSSSAISGLVVVDRGRPKRIRFDRAEEFAWSPRGGRIAVVDSSITGPSTLYLVRPDGGGRRKLSSTFGARHVVWSRDGRFIAFNGGGELRVIDVKTGAVQLVDGVGEHAWSAKADVLAFDGKSGLELFDPRSEARRVLTSDHAKELTWSPNGRAIAYVVDLKLPDYSSGDLKVASTSGAVRMLVAASATGGGEMRSLGWIRPSGGVRYRPPGTRSVATVSAGQLASPWKIERIATDGGRVAYVTCGRIFVWTPATSDVSQAEPTASPLANCHAPDDLASFEPFEIYDLALAGDRVAFGTRSGNSVQRFSLYEEALSPIVRAHLADHVGWYADCTVGDGGLGELVGARDLLVFSRWKERNLDSLPAPCRVRTLSQEIHRLQGVVCPCPLVAAAPGQLVPADVDDGRLVVVGENRTLILDRSGAQMSSIQVSAASAQLSGSDLVVLTPGELRRYDAQSGALRNAWPVANVGARGRCGSPHPWTCTSPLVLLDAAGGFAAYSFDGNIHTVRLADGDDAVIGSGTTAGFFSGGLVYAEGTRLHVISFEKLALR